MKEETKQAIRPNFYKEFTTKVDEVSEDVEVDESQQALAFITHYKGWALLKDYKQRLEDYLDTMVSEAIASGADFKDIGQRTMIKELAKYVLTSFIDKAENARRKDK
jgi:fructose-1-phosphate kinase PfkB-like protein